MVNAGYWPGRRVVASMVLGLVCLGADCPVVTVEVGRSNPDDDGTPPPDSVRVVLRNNHPSAAVDVDLFATATAVTNVDAELFTLANEIGNLGFAGTGLIPAGDEDSVILSCAEARVIGTSGGRFVDPDSNEELGFGQPRVVSQDVSFSCGDTITFQFESRDGGFATPFFVE